MKLYYYNKKDGNKSTDTEKMILTSLESYCGKPQSAFRIIRNPYGKPLLENGEYFVGVSHTNDIVVIAIHTENFGIDCEAASRIVNNKERIAKKYYSDEEYHYVFEDGLTESDTNYRFLDIWVKKEAYVKFIGTGIRDLAKCNTFSLDGSFEKVIYGNNIIYIYRG